MDTHQACEVRYLDNSGFTVKTGHHLFIFDYFNTKPDAFAAGPEAGILDPGLFSQENTVVFVSHGHFDHFNPEILSWTDKTDKLQYVLSHDVSVPQGVWQGASQMRIAFPNETYELDGILVRTLKSTDEGVAYLVTADDLTIYHAGDLNWWHWEGEPEAENRAMALDYRGQIDLLKGAQIDIAFIPVDPRLNGAYLWGLDYFMRHTETKTVFPMHFGQDFTMFERLREDPAAQDYIKRIVTISRRGQQFAL
jgi:L-ascorbate metabolism protein UlaG (beta-lactamase superfamily)